MVRSSRINASNFIYHVYSRGVEKRKIFLDDDDCYMFLSLCKDLSSDLNFKLFSYCLMANHYHLYLKTLDGNLSQIMHKLNFKYARYFNLKYNRVGHLFQGRFGDKVVEDKEYRQELIRYIALNPVWAKMVSSPEEWKWSSYKFLLVNSGVPSFLDRQWCLDQFNGSLEHLINFVNEAVEDPEKYGEENLQKIEQRAIVRKAFLEAESAVASLDYLGECTKQDLILYYLKNIRKLKAERIILLDDKLTIKSIYLVNRKLNNRIQKDPVLFQSLDRLRVDNQK